MQSRDNISMSCWLVTLNKHPDLHFNWSLCVLESWVIICSFDHISIKLWTSSQVNVCPQHANEVSQNFISSQKANLSLLQPLV